MSGITIQELNDAAVDVEFISLVANSANETEVDRLGRTRRTIEGLSAEFPDASVNAANALGSKNSAQAARLGAEEAQAAAEAASDVAQMSTSVYVDTSAGLAATTHGQYFSVPASDANEYLILYKNNSGSALEIKRYPSVAGVALAASYAQSAINSGIATAYRNIFDPLQAVDGYLLSSSDGTVTASAGSFVTGFMPVTPGGYVSVSEHSLGFSGWGYAFYDYTKHYISGSDVQIDNRGYVAVPADACFFRVSYYGLIAARSQLHIAPTQSLPNYFLPFNEPESFSSSSFVVDIANKLNSKRANLNDQDRNSQNVAIQATDGAAVSFSGYFATDFIPVLPGVQVTFPLPPLANGTTYGVAYYNQKKQFVSGDPGTFGSVNQVLTIPAGVFFLRCSAINSKQDAFQVLQGDLSAGTSHYYTSKPAVLADSRPWSGRNLVVQGDSFEDLYSWPQDLVAYHGFASLVQHSRSGRKMEKALYRLDDTTPLTSDDFMGKDVVLLKLMTNDAGAATTLGDLTDSTTAATYYGQAKNFIETVLGWNQLIKIIIATAPTYRSGRTVAEMQVYADALREIAAYYGLPVLDLAKNSMGNPITAATLFPDGTHPKVPEGYTACITGPAKAFFHTVFPNT